MVSPSRRVVTILGILPLLFPDQKAFKPSILTTHCLRGLKYLRYWTMASFTAAIGGAPVPVAGLPESHRNSPLAPSQEIAYRQKCIDLKRRLSEIEANNDSIRQRLTRERHFQDKMRLNRAILLNHMKELIEKPSRRFGEDNMEKVGATSRKRMRGSHGDKSNGFAFDDSSDISSSDEVQEVLYCLMNRRLVYKWTPSLIVLSQMNGPYALSVLVTARLEHRLQ